MKKILIFLLISLGVAVYAQPETVNVGSSPDDGTGDPLRTAMQKLNTNDVAAFDSLAVQRIDSEANRVTGSDNSDSIGVHDPKIQTNIATGSANTTNTGANNQSIGELNESVSTLLDGGIWEITDGGDSIKLTIGSSYVKTAVDRAVIADNIVPTILSGNIGQQGNDQLFILFSENMNGDSIPTHTHGVSGISIYNTDGDGEVLINGTYLSNDTCIITLDSSIVSGDVIYIDHIKPTANKFQDLAGNNLSSFTNVGITLTLSTLTTAYESWMFNDNSLGTANIPGTEGNLTLEWYNTTGPEYYLPGYEGAAAASSLGVATHLTSTEDIDLTGDFTMGSWFKGSTSEFRYIFAIEDTWWVFLDYVADQIQVWERVGGTTTATSSAGLTDMDNEWRFIVIRYDYSEGHMATFYDGVNVSLDSVVDAATANPAELRIMGIGAAGSGYILADAFQVYDSYLTEAEILTWFNNPSSGISEDPGDPIEPASSDVYFDTQFTHALGSEYTKVLQEIDFGDNAFTNCTNNVHIVSFDGNTVLRNEYEEGHCCNCGVDYHPSGQGTGLNARNYIKANHTGYDHFYMSYNIYLTDPFNIGQSVEACAGSCEMKLPGPTALSTSGVWNDNCFIRLKLFNYNGYDGYWRWIGKFTGESSSQFPTVRFESDLIPRGQWVNVTIRVSNNTNYTSNYNGILELFIDGVLLGSWSGLKLTGYNGQVFNCVEYSTHMGGSGWALTAPQDQYMYLDDMVWWNYKDEIEWAIPQGETSPTGRTLVFPDECNVPK